VSSTRLRHSEISVGAIQVPASAVQSRLDNVNPGVGLRLEQMRQLQGALKQRFGRLQLVPFDIDARKSHALLDTFEQGHVANFQEKRRVVFRCTVQSTARVLHERQVTPRAATDRCFIRVCRHGQLNRRGIQIPARKIAHTQEDAPGRMAASILGW